MTRHAVRRGGTRLLVGAALISAVATIAPAHAIIGTPVMQGNSVPNGYTKTPLAVAITYNTVINPSLSDVEVLDVNGDPVSGTIGLDLVTEKTLIFNTTNSSRFGEELSPYTATFTARARNQSILAPNSVETLVFNVDYITPFPPNVHLNDSTDATVPAVSLPGDDLIINGIAADIEPDSGIVSGVARVDIHFYNPVTNASAILRGGIPEVSRETVTFPCTGGCDKSEILALDISDLALGYWNIKVSVTDAAGNQSAQSAPMAVLKVAAPV
jgi:hypothetical protein